MFSRLKLFMKIKVSKYLPKKMWHMVEFDTRQHDISIGWISRKSMMDDNRKIELRPDVRLFVLMHDGFLQGKDLSSCMATIYIDYSPSEHEEQILNIHRIYFPLAESAVEFKLRFL